MTDLPQPRSMTESQAETTQAILPSDSNALGTLFGGKLMQWIDLVGATAASRHARTYVVTASMDHLDFVAPVRVGELLILKASVNRAYKTSMEVGVRAMVENVREGTLRHVSTAYLTFVAITKDGVRVEVPQVIPETENQRRRFDDAQRRRDMRAGEVQRMRDMRKSLPPVWNI